MLMQTTAAVALSCSGYLARNGRLATAFQPGVRCRVLRPSALRRKWFWSVRAVESRRLCSRDCLVRPPDVCVCLHTHLPLCMQLACARVVDNTAFGRLQGQTRCWQEQQQAQRCCWVRAFSSILCMRQRKTNLARAPSRVSLTSSPPSWARFEI